MDLSVWIEAVECVRINDDTTIDAVADLAKASRAKTYSFICLVVVAFILFEETTSCKEALLNICNVWVVVKRKSFQLRDTRRAAKRRYRHLLLSVPKIFAIKVNVFGVENIKAAALGTGKV